MFLSEHAIKIPTAAAEPNGLLARLGSAVAEELPEAATPIRFVVTESSPVSLHAEVGVMYEVPEFLPGRPDSIFRFVKRPRASSLGAFNVALLVPTGVGAEIGGHAGDAAPVVRLLGGLCDTVITHPNVVNASDLNEIPENGLYVEGSVLSRLLMGTAGLLPTRSNRVLAVIDKHRDELFVSAAVNTVNAARTAYGLRCPRVVQLDPSIRMSTKYAESGRATGRVDGLERLCRILVEQRNEYDAVALSSVIDVPGEYHTQYFEAAGEMVNPWGGVEAMLTHAISCLFDVPSAHSPMLESREVANLDPGVVDSRMAAEAISLSFFQCVLKGLHRSPSVVTDPEDLRSSGVLTASDVSAMVIPDGCLGLPTLAALEQGISVVAVRENRTLMRNDLGALPWQPGQFWLVENYWEAVGVLAALKAGIAAEAVRRPIGQVEVAISSTSEEQTRQPSATKALADVVGSPAAVPVGRPVKGPSLRVRQDA